MLFFNSNQQFKSIFESLEDRVLFDGVPDATFVLPQTDVDQPAPAQVQDAQAADISGPRELILVDAGVADSDQFLAEVLEANPDSMFEIRFLDSDQDGIEQISQLLSAEDAQYSAIHIISHGDEGEVVLGNSSLTADNLNQYADQLAGWADALTEDADLLFYGCDLAGDEEGKQFIEAISAVTGADVAASDDLTGAAELGGDWDLELNVGTIETAALIAENWPPQQLRTCSSLVTTPMPLVMRNPVLMQPSRARVVRLHRPSILLTRQLARPHLMAAHSLSAIAPTGMTQRSTSLPTMVFSQALLAMQCRSIL